MLKCPKDKTNKLKLWQTANGASTIAAMRCSRTRKLKQSSFNPKQIYCSVEATDGTKSIAQPNIAIDRKERNVRASNPSEATGSTNDMKSHTEARQKETVKAITAENARVDSSKRTD